MSKHLPADEGFIYFVASSGLIKIGFANNVRNRFFAIRALSPVSVSLLGWFETFRSEETAWHARFASSHHHAEWFAETPELLAAIADALSRDTANRFNGQHFRKRRAVAV